MLFRRMLRMFVGMEAVSMRQVCVVSRFLVMAISVMLCGCTMVPRGVVMMLSRLRMVMSCFL
jgi:hypothetical protein